MTKVFRCLWFSQSSVFSLLLLSCFVWVLMLRIRNYLIGHVFAGFAIEGINTIKWFSGYGTTLFRQSFRPLIPMDNS